MIELSPEQTTSLGPLLVAVSKALTRVTGCSKTYVAMFAEAEGFQHLHIHVIPRAADLSDGLKGPKIFDYLHRAENEWVSVVEMDALAARLKADLDTEIIGKNWPG